MISPLCLEQAEGKPACRLNTLVLITASVAAVTAESSLPIWPEMIADGGNKPFHTFPLAGTIVTHVRRGFLVFEDLLSLFKRGCSTVHIAAGGIIVVASDDDHVIKFYGYLILVV